MFHALRVLAVLGGSFVALYLLVHLVSAAALDLLEWTILVRFGPDVERFVSLLGAGVGAALFVARRGHDVGSLERLWTFVFGVHLLAYLLFYPYFRLVDVRSGAPTLLDATPGTVAYHAVGYGLLLAAFAGAYVLVYRCEPLATLRRFAN